jgi:hypothetical protein
MRGRNFSWKAVTFSTFARAALPNARKEPLKKLLMIMIKSMKPRVIKKKKDSKKKLTANHMPTGLTTLIAE